MGKYREVQNLNIPVKLPSNAYMVTMDINPGADTGEQLYATVEKDDGTKIVFKGDIPEFSGLDAGPLVLNVTLAKVSS